MSKELLVIIDPQHDFINPTGHYAICVNKINRMQTFFQTCYNVAIIIPETSNSHIKTLPAIIS